MSKANNQDRYAARGVSSSKEDVYKAIANLDKGLFPNAFCKILPDVFSNNSDMCSIVHADGCGTKASLAFLYWKETKDIDIWKNIAQDAIVMNTDDMLCAGVVNNMVFCSVINRNKSNIPAEVIASLISGANEFFIKLKDHGINVLYGGGETADLGDVVRTVTVDATMSANLLRSEVIEAKVRPGDVILGLASYGQATYESVYNSGIASNGLTAARHETLDHYYRQFEESYNPAVDKSLVYNGKLRLTDMYEDAPLNVGQLLLSPTRTYLPVMSRVYDLYRKKINAVIHCTGGGQRKVMHYAKEGVRIVKNDFLDIPHVFRMIQSQGEITWQEMYNTFNMGHRMEIYTDDHTAKLIGEIASEFDIESKIVGYVTEAKGRELILETPHGTFQY